MSKRYQDPIEVESSNGSPRAFFWRGKRYQIRQILTRWRESGGWWDSTSSEQPWLNADSKEIVRVDAIGRTRGTYEIARDLRTGAWTMFRVLD